MKYPPNTLTKIVTEYLKVINIYFLENRHMSKPKLPKIKMPTLDGRLKNSLKTEKDALFQIKMNGDVLTKRAQKLLDKLSKN